MALDLYLQKDTSLPETTTNRFLSFEDDGCFWFLYELFEDLAKRTGQTIELYEDAFFEGENLDSFNQTVKQAKLAMLKKPETWEEFIGTVICKEKGRVEKRFSTVNKKKLESILMKLENAILEAKDNNIGVFFFGD